MAIPRIPVPRVPSPWYPVPQVPVIQPPSVPTLGGSSPLSGWELQQRENEKRKEWFFDKNNPNQVNSVADVIVNSLNDFIKNARRFSEAPIQNLMRMAIAPKKLSRDIGDLTWRGAVRPIIERDPTALANNLWTNFTETVDLVDNLYKGYAIEREKSGMLLRGVDPNAKKTLTGDWKNFQAGSHQAGVEGFKRAWNRENFDFEGGHWARNMTREMATPTNLLLLGAYGLSKMGVKGLASTGLSKKTVTFVRQDFTGDMAKTLTKAIKVGAANADDVKIIHNLLHGQGEIIKLQKNFKFLANVNKVRQPLDAFDSLGPRLAWATTGTPSWWLVKNSYKYGVAPIKYMTATINNKAIAHLKPGEALTLVKFDITGNASEVRKVEKGFGEVMFNEGENLMVKTSEVYYNTLATQDSKLLDGLIQALYTRADEAKLMQQALSEDPLMLRKVTPDEMSQIIQLRKAEVLQEGLNQFARRTSNDALKTFDDYVRYLEDLYNSDHGATWGVEQLYHKAKQIQDLPKKASSVQSSVKLKEELSDIFKRGQTPTNELRQWGEFGQAYKKYHKLKEAINVFEDEYISSFLRKRKIVVSPDSPKIELFRIERSFNNGEGVLTKGSKEYYQALMDGQYRINRAYFEGNDDAYFEFAGLLGDYQDALGILQELTPRLDKGALYLRLAEIYGNTNEIVGRFIDTEAFKYLDRDDATLLQSIYDKTQRNVKFLRDNASHFNELTPSEYIDIIQDSIHFISQSVESIDSLAGIEKAIMDQFALPNPDTIKQLFKTLVGTNTDDVLNKMIDQLKASKATTVTKELVDYMADDFIAKGGNIPQDIYDKAEAVFRNIPDVRRLLYDIIDDTNAAALTDMRLDVALSIENVFNNLVKLRELGKRHGSDISDIKGVRDTFEAIMEDIFVVEQFVQRYSDQLAKRERGFTQVTVPYSKGGLTIPERAVKQTELLEFIERMNIPERQLNDLGLSDVVVSGVIPKPRTVGEMNQLLKRRSAIQEELKVIQRPTPKDMFSSNFRHVNELKEELSKLNEVLFKPSPYENYMNAPFNNDPDVIQLLKDKVSELRGLTDVRHKDAIMVMTPQKDMALLDNKGIIDAFNDLTNTFQKSFGINEEILIKYQKENERVYQFQLSALYRWAQLYSNETIMDTINLYRSGMDDFDPAFKSIKGLVYYGDKFAAHLKGELTNFKQGLRTFEQLSAYYESFTGKALDIKDVDRLNEWLDEMLSLRDAAISVESTLKHMGAFTDFLDELGTSGLGEELGVHLLDAMESFYDMPHNLVTGKETTLETMLYVVKEQVNKLLRSKNLKYNFRLENAVSAMEDMAARGIIDLDLIKEHHDLFGKGAAHTALADAHASLILRKHFFKDEVAKGKIVAVDIETNTLNKNVGTPHQIGVVTDGGERILFMRKNLTANEMPTSDSLYRILFGQDVKTPLETLKADFHDIYVNGNLDKYKQRFGAHEGVRIIQCDSNEMMGKELARVLSKELVPEQGKMTLDLFNGKGFDVDVLNKMFERSGEGYRIYKSHIRDSLVDMEKKFGVRKLDLEEEQKIYDMLERYINRREAMRDTMTAKMESKLLNDPHMFGGSFVPSLDEAFSVNLKRIIQYYGDPNGIKTLKESNVDSITSELLSGEFKPLETLLAEVRKQQQLVSRGQKELHNMRISSEDVHKFFDEDIFYDGIHKSMRSDKNIMVALSRLADMHGLAVPVINVKRVQHVNSVVTWFGETMNVGGKQVPRTVNNPFVLERMTLLARKLDKSMEYMGNVNVLETLGSDSNSIIKEAHAIMADELRKLPKNNWRKALLSELEMNESSIRNLAILVEYAKTYNLVAQELSLPTSKLYDKIKLISEPLSDVLRNPSLLSDRHKISMVDDTKKFFHMDLEGDMGKLMKYVKLNSETAIQTLDIIENNMDKIGFTAQLRRLYSVYRPLLEAVNETESLVLKLAESPDEAQKMFAELRVLHEPLDAFQSYSSLKHLLSMTPDDMAGFLWHYAKGGAYFNIKDLNSVNYFKARNKIEAPHLFKSADNTHLYKQILDNKKAYADAGIIITESKYSGRIAFELNKDLVDKFKELPYKQIDSDYDFSEVLDLIKNQMRANETLGKHADAFTGALRKVVDARRHITELLPSGARSSLERMDDRALTQALENLGGRVSNKAFSVEDMVDLGRFEGNPFNHSVFGHIDSRRELMEFASFNPAKTMMNAAHTLHGMVDMKHQYMLTVFGDEWKLSSLAKDMSHEDIFNYFKKNTHMTLGFLQETKHGDYKVSRFILRNVNDVAKALEFGATVMDTHTFTKTVQTINYNRLGIRPLEWIQRSIATPWKLSVMGWNYWTVARNIFDSGMKNINESGAEFSMIKMMFDTFDSYLKYVSTAKEVTAMMKTKKNISADAALELVFKEGKNKLSREVYDEITFFKQNAASSGMVREMKSYYGDAVKKSFRRVEVQGVNIHMEQYKELLMMPDDVAEAWLKKQFPTETEVQRILQRGRTDFRDYKRAYAMLTHYKGQELTVDNIVEVMRRPELIERWSPKAQELYFKGLEATKSMSYKDDLMTKIMNWAPVDKSLDWHGGTEEVLRLSLYRWLKDQGDSHMKAADRVTKVHFDYSNKSRAENFIELAFPFSTFRRNSIQYWGEQLANKPHLVQTVGKYKNAQADHSEYEVEDLMMRRGVMYHMLAGNIMSNEKGRAIKLMPSVIDSINFLIDPPTYLAGAVHPIAQDIKFLLTEEKPDWMDQEAYDLQKQRKLVGMIPFVGAWINRATHPDGNLLANIAFGGIVSKVWTPEQRKEYMNYPYGLSPFRRQYPRKYYPRRFYPRRFFPKNLKVRRNPNQYINSYWANLHLRNEATYRNRNAYLNRWLRGANMHHSILRSEIVTRKNNPRARYISFPTNKYTVGMKAALFRGMVNRRVRR